jgi:hypothetical protein
MVMSIRNKLISCLAITVVAALSFFSVIGAASLFVGELPPPDTAAFMGIAIWCMAMVLAWSDPL